MSVHQLARATVLIAGRVEHLFTDKQIYLRRSTCSDIALAALLRNACRTSRAIAFLARGGYGSNALALTRSMADIWITVRWLTNKDTQFRTMRFLGFDSRQRERIIELLGEYYPAVNLDRFAGNDRHDQQARGYPRWDMWGPGIGRMADEDETFETESEGVTSPRWTHDVTFFISSYHLHPTSLGLRHHFLQAGDTFDFRPRHGEDQFASHGLVSTLQCLSRSASRIGLFWGVNAEDPLSSLWEKYVTPVIKLAE